MVYDEGFEVNVEGLTFFAFSRFDLTYDDAGVRRNSSRCGATQLGWYRDKSRTQWGCYIGHRVKANGDFEVDDSNLDSERRSNETRPANRGNNLESLLAAAGASLIQARPAQSYSLYDMPLGWKAHKDFVEHINLVQSSWSATVYNRFVGRSARQMNRMAGIKRVRPAVPVSLAQKGSFTYRSRGLRKSRARSHDMPSAHDWRDVDGNSWVEPVANQGRCGSCYTVATIHMLTARNRIKQKDASIEPFSVEFPLHCAEYNQGCNGGYAFLAAKWSEDVGLLPSSCTRFAPHGKCDVMCDVTKEKRWRAANHRYVGGFYGGASEDAMMTELFQGGPLVVSLEPHRDLMYYRSGIYKHTGESTHEHGEWERVDHAVLLVGFGLENVTKYWTLQNSWGSDWGEIGFFRMVRGVDESGVESIAVAAEVVEEDRPEIAAKFLETAAR
jgi:cathepsin C